MAIFWWTKSPARAAGPSNASPSRPPTGPNRAAGAAVLAVFAILAGAELRSSAAGTFLVAAGAALAAVAGVMIARR